MNGNYQRRTFRGRGGPTDRNLPGHQARRRLPSRSSTTQSEEAHLEAENKSFNRTIISEDVEDSRVSETSPSEPEESGADVGPQIVDPLDKELRHLIRRIRNNRKDFSSSHSLSMQYYRNQVLNAAKGCFVEWNAITRQYRCQIDDQNTQIKATSLELFQLLQQVLQTGPFKGSKPGYFKKCGSDTARNVFDWLDELFPDPTEEKYNSEASYRFFSSTQLQRIQQWKKDAGTAAQTGKPPSKSLQVMQHQDARRRGVQKVRRNKSKK